MTAGHVAARSWLRAVPAGFPQALMNYRQWMIWKPEWVPDARRWSKPPCDPRTGFHASKTDPRHFGTVYEACGGMSRRGFMGAGFCFTPADAFAFCDLDHCRNPVTGEVEPWARAIVDELRTYTEVSPSGCGIHLVMQGSLPPDGRKRGRVELKDAREFLTITGYHLEGTPATVRDRSAELLALHRRVFGDPSSAPAIQSGTLPVSAEVILEKARRARNGAKFERLWSGDWTQYTSQSEADLALCRLLAYWGADARQIDSLFRHSALMRDKWNENRGGGTYGQRTIDKAVGAACDCRF